jgi:hypothetical protein
MKNKENKVSEGGQMFPNGIWLARDLFTGVTGGNVYLFTEKPKKNERCGIFEAINGEFMYMGGMDDFPEITWENSPHHVKVIITGLIESEHGESMGQNIVGAGGPATAEGKE